MASAARIDRSPDLVVIGGGAGGLAAARHGAAVTMIQAGPVGGDCTFTGCVPSKALIEAAHRRDPFERAITAARRAVEVIAATETDEVLAREGIEVLHGWAELRSAGAVDVDGSTIRTSRIVIATGARPVVPPIEGLADAEYLTNESVWELDTLPSSLAVLGGGAIGCELAQAFARLGSAVTLIEGLDRLLPREAPEASAVIVDALTADGVMIRTDATVRRIERREPKGAVSVHLADGTAVDADRLLVSVGRAPAVEGLGVEAAGIATERGAIRTDDTLATTAKGVWAVGDVTGRLQFTHAADEMGRVAVANAFSRAPRRRFRTDAIPWVTFTDPEVATVGASESHAAYRGGRVAFLPMSEVDRAIAADETLGFVKLIAGPRPLLRNAGGGRILGATIVAPRAGELIHEPALAIRTGMFAGRLAQTVHAYPTWSVAVRQAAAQFFMETGGRHTRPAAR